jgi:hypothetical protein
MKNRYTVIVIFYNNSVLNPIQPLVTMSDILQNISKPTNNRKDNMAYHNQMIHHLDKKTSL